jgi:hypothetical protein
LGTLAVVGRDGLARLGLAGLEVDHALAGLAVAEQGVAAPGVAFGGFTSTTSRSTMVMPVLEPADHGFDVDLQGLVERLTAVARSSASWMREPRSAASIGGLLAGLEDAAHVVVFGLLLGARVTDTG